MKNLYLLPEDVAETIRLAIEAPSHVEVARLAVMPVDKPEREDR